MSERGGLDPLVIGVYAVAGALLLLLLLTSAALESSSLLGVVAVLAWGLGWGLSWLMARAFGGRPWLHALALVALPLLFALYSMVVHDAAAPGLRIGWLALLAATALASMLGAVRGLAAAARARAESESDSDSDSFPPRP
jgi:hypothetical protein